MRCTTSSAPASRAILGILKCRNFQAHQNVKELHTMCFERAIELCHVSASPVLNDVFERVRSPRGHKSCIIAVKHVDAI